MKTREDFVSNSSSCSFVVKDIEHGLSVIEELSILDSMEMDEMDVYFTASLQDAKKHKLEKYESWRDEEEGYVYCRCSCSALASFSSDVTSSFKELWLSCSDCDQGAVFILSLLYEALKSAGVDVSDEDTEISFPSLDDSKSAAAKLINFISSYKQSSLKLKRAAV